MCLNGCRGGASIAQVGAVHDMSLRLGDTISATCIAVSVYLNCKHPLHLCFGRGLMMIQPHSSQQTLNGKLKKEGRTFKAFGRTRHGPKYEYEILYQCLTDASRDWFGTMEQRK